MTDLDEAHRHQCELNYLRALPRGEHRGGRDWYLKLILEKRGQAVADRLRNELLQRNDI